MGASQQLTSPPPPRRARTNWTVARRIATAWLRDRAQFADGKLPRECPICLHTGIMIGVGHPPRWDARCAQCGSRERHRLLWLWATAAGGNRLSGKRILHFAPEKALRRALRGNPGYETADLRQRGVTHQVDITRLPMASETYDIVIANHVLEHIDADRLAMRELFRVLKPGGFALLTAPINPTRQETYENPAITDPVARAAHFNAPDIAATMASTSPIGWRRRGSGWRRGGCRRTRRCGSACCRWSGCTWRPGRGEAFRHRRARPAAIEIRGQAGHGFSPIVMARIVRATRVSTLPRELARTGRAMTMRDRRRGVPVAGAPPR